MPIMQFKIGPIKALRLAECERVPRLMVIAGPNGVGKSTLLWALKQHAGKVQHTGRLLYLSPHRIWRRQSIQMTHLWENPRNFSDILAGDSFGSFPGVRVLDGNRAPDSADESFSAVKYTLSQFETRKQNAVNALLDRNGKVTKEEVGDIYEPIRELTQSLLPHMEFKRIDLSERSNVRVFFERKDKYGATEVELDDLSSGERSLISMFMPFLEAEISGKLDAIGRPKSPPKAGITEQKPVGDIVVLIDEPEIHLHPYLQGRLLGYFRAVTSRGGVQFILTTHSPTILDAADYEELFVLNPPGVASANNQLTQLASSIDRLAALRLLGGETYNLTVGRKLLCIEGEFPSGEKNRATDVRLLELLCPDITSYVLLPFGGKSNTLEAAKRLRELLPKAFDVQNVQALVDKDTDVPSGESWTHQLPVAMIENFLLSPLAIWDFLQPHRERVALSNEQDVRNALSMIARGRRDQEIVLRIQRRLPLVKIRFEGRTREKIIESLADQLTAAREQLPDSELLDRIIVAAESDVQKIIENNQELRLFHGKEILREFYHAHVHALGIAYETFCLQLAKWIGQNKILRRGIAKDLEPLVEIEREAATESLAEV